MDDAELIEHALRGPLAPVADAVRAAVLPSVRLVRAGSADAVVGRLGGVPHLPPASQWPSWRGRPLAHLAEIDLAAVPQVGPGRELLPAQGRLSFFFDVGEDQPWGFDPDDRGSGRVLFTPPHAAREPLRPPAAPQLEAAYAEGPLAARVELTLPDPYGPAATGIPEALRQAYQHLATALFERHGGEDEPQHRLLGHPDEVQGEMQTQVQLVTNGLYCGDSSGYEDPRAQALAAGATGWRLLLQLDSEFGDDEMMWGDAGRIYFWGHATSMRRGDFGGIWTILQCG